MPPHDIWRKPPLVHWYEPLSWFSLTGRCGPCGPHPVPWQSNHRPVTVHARISVPVLLTPITHNWAVVNCLTGRPFITDYVSLMPVAWPRFRLHRRHLSDVLRTIDSLVQRVPEIATVYSDTLVTWRFAQSSSLFLMITFMVVVVRRHCYFLLLLLQYHEHYHYCFYYYFRFIVYLTPYRCLLLHNVT